MSKVLVAAVVVFAVLACHPAMAAAGTADEGPLKRTVLATLAAERATSSPPSEKARTDWAAVRRLRPGSDIIVTIRGVPAATRRLLSVDEDELVLFDSSDPGLPNDARRTLNEVAADRPSLLLTARADELQLPRHVRATPAGIFVEQQRVAGLAGVIKVVPRGQVADVRVRRNHVGTHSRRGFLIGAAIGAGIGVAIGASSSEDTLPLMGFGALGGGVWGLEIGTVIGILAPRSPDVIYHVD
jgi:hypothetical protein